jgi:hypothetical protein
MASDFIAAFQAQFNPAALQHFAEDVTYKPSAATAKTVDVVVIRESRHRVFDESGAVLHDEIEVFLAEDDVATPIDIMAASGSGVDYLTIDGTTFYVLEIVERSAGGWHRLRCGTKVFA